MAVNFDALRKMTNEDLHELNTAIVVVINERIADRRRSAMNRFGVGSKAAFRNSRTGDMVYVMIQRRNTKTFGCIELDGEGRQMPNRIWRVPPNMLMSVGT